MNKTKKVVRLTESDLHNIVKESVKKVLKESMWGDGTEQRKAWHICSVGDVEEDAEEAYHIYDGLSHGDLSPEKAIKYCLANFGDTGDGAEPEFISRSCYNYGSWGKYFITVDFYTGIVDVWEEVEN